MNTTAPDRAEIIVVFNRKQCAFHFTSGPLQTARNDRPLWFPAVANELFFHDIELVMQWHGAAYHCVNIEKIRECGGEVDYRVTYSPVRKEIAS